jgi:pimeloyl-ACP methyl ester carboxylesterase
MAMTSYLDLSPTRRLAFAKIDGASPTVVFLGGFKSDMTGTKALDLQAWAIASGQAFLRLDYAGHGQSSGVFEDGCIGDWMADAGEVIARTTNGPLVLVGSSMGGWIAMLLARSLPDRIAGLVGIAAAPDFTDWIENALTDVQRGELDQTGRISEPSAYGHEPYVYTRRLIEDGRQRRIFDRPLHLPFPARFLQGTADVDVPPAVALRLMDHADGPDLRLTLVKCADHRFSSPDCLALVRATVAEICAASSPSSVLPLSGNRA